MALDQLKITATAIVPNGGSYAMWAPLVGPNGGIVATIDQAAMFTAGANPLAGCPACCLLGIALGAHSY